MPRLSALPELAIIKALKGTLDFAIWRGVPYVRKWPRVPRSHLTPATLAAGAIFGAISKAYQQQAPEVIDSLHTDNLQPAVGPKDVYTRAVLGWLHEVPEVPPPPTDDMILIQDFDLAAPQADFDFLAIPGTFKHLQIIGSVRADGAGTQAGCESQFNGDAGLNYSFQQWEFRATTHVAPWNQINVGYLRMGVVCGNGAPPNEFSAFKVLIPNYAGTLNNKEILADSFNRLGTSGNSHRWYEHKGEWINTPAIFRIRIYSGGANWMTGSRCSLYGLN